MMQRQLKRLKQRKEKLAKLKTNINKFISENEEKRKQKLSKSQTAIYNMRQLLSTAKQDRLKHGEEDWKSIFSD